MFSGGWVYFNGAEGAAPSGLVPSGGQRLQTGLSLPSAIAPSVPSRRMFPAGRMGTVADERSSVR